MKRREFIALAGAAAAFPRAAFAQQAAKVPHVAFLATPRPKYQTDGLFQGFADRGYTDGKNIVVDWFIAPTTADLPAFAEKALASLPAVIVADNADATLAAAHLTKTIPIVFRTLLDPVRQGMVSSLAHPGANVTGAAGDGSITAAKAFGFLKEMMPGLSRTAFFAGSGDISDAIQRADVLAVGAAAGIDIIVIDVTDPSDLRPYFAQAVAARVQAVDFGSYSYSSVPITLDALNALTAGQKQQPTFNDAYLTANNNVPARTSVLNYLALLNGLAAFWPGALAAPGIDPGALFLYGESVPDGFRRVAYFVDNILRGAKPQDLPVELPTNYGLSINLKTAKALGLVVPPDMLLIATQVYE